MAAAARSASRKCGVIETQKALRADAAERRGARCICERIYENTSISFQTFSFCMNSGKVLRGFSMHLHKLCIAKKKKKVGKKKVTRNADDQGNRAVLNDKMYFLFSATAHSVTCRILFSVGLLDGKGLQTVKIFIFLYAVFVFLVFLAKEISSLEEMIC